jgi:hypothetical protein
MSNARNLSKLLGTDTQITTPDIADGVFQANKNLIINGAMAVNQRGTQTGVRTAFGVDRFKLAGDGAQIFTFSQSTTVPSGQGFSYSAKLDVTTADTSIAAGQYQLLQYIFEGQDLQHLKYGTSGAKSITLQFWVRSPKTGTHIVELNHQDAVYFNSQAYTIASADTWQKVTLTFSGYQTTAITNDNTFGFSIAWWLMAGSTYSGGTLASNTWQNTAANRAAGQVNVVDSTSNEFYITGVQLEVGSTATPFEHRSFGDELAACQRYYYAVSDETSVFKYPFYVASAYSTAQANGGITLPVTMRTTPTVSYGNNFRFYRNSTYEGFSTLVNDGSTNLSLNFAGVGMSHTAGTSGNIQIRIPDGGFIKADAEL